MSTSDRPPAGGEEELQDIHGELTALADHLGQHREAMVLAWQRAIQRDPELTDGDSLPRAELVDHIPALLAAFERSLRAAAADGTAAAQVPARSPPPRTGCNAGGRAMICARSPANWASSMNA